MLPGQTPGTELAWYSRLCRIARKAILRVGVRLTVFPSLHILHSVQQVSVGQTHDLLSNRESSEILERPRRCKRLGTAFITIANISIVFPMRRKSREGAVPSLLEPDDRASHVQAIDRQSEDLPGWLHEMLCAGASS